MKKRFVLIAVFIVSVAGFMGCAADPSSKYGGDTLFAGLPQATSELSHFKKLSNIGYIVGYSEHRKDPLWAAYRLKRMENPPNPGPRPKKFKMDERTDAKVKHEDYTNSGYDRGHMAPNWAIATRYGQDAQLETFLMSNICPQKHKLNGGMWKYLEMIIAKAYANQFGDIWVFAGPIFDDDVQTLKSGDEIPDEFYTIMVIIEDDQIQMQAFVMGQEQSGREPLGNFITNIDNIEDKTGLDFFTDLPDKLEEKLESSTPSQAWLVEEQFVNELPKDCRETAPR
jgi:endonuclease G